MSLGLLFPHLCSSRSYSTKKISTVRLIVYQVWEKFCEERNSKPIQLTMQFKPTYRRVICEWTKSLTRSKIGLVRSIGDWLNSVFSTWMSKPLLVSLEKKPGKFGRICLPKKLEITSQYKLLVEVLRNQLLKLRKKKHWNSAKYLVSSLMLLLVQFSKSCWKLCKRLLTKLQSVKRIGRRYYRL